MRLGLIAVGAGVHAGPYTFVAADALVLKVPERGRVVNVNALVAAGVNAEGYREILGIDGIDVRMS
jgi:putative transposase